MSGWELAQLNVADLAAPLDSPQLADFVANLDRINSLAEASPGFVWRLKDDGGNATESNEPFDDKTIVNLSVWENVDALHHYVYQTAHTDVMRRRQEWFIPRSSVSAVLWWVPKGHRPDAYEAQSRLLLLNKLGSTHDAFTFKQRMDFPA